MDDVKEKIPPGVSLGKDIDIDYSSPRIAVWVECSLPLDVHFDGLRITKQTKRGSFLDMHGFKYDQEKKVFGFFVSSHIHQSFKTVWGDEAKPKCLVAMTFGDYCWILSDGSNNMSVQEISTPIRETLMDSPVVLGDLTQVLPSKFADDVIDTLAVMNWHVLEGIIEEAVLYGPFVQNKKEE